MTDDRTVRTKHGQLTLEQLAELLPSTGQVMQSVGECWWKCAYAARGGNWPLAAYFARRVRSLQRDLAVLRPKHRERLETFESGVLAAVFTAIAAEDRDAFDLAFESATALANEMHVQTGYGYIRWTLPDEAPKDLDLRRQQEPDRRP